MGQLADLHTTILQTIEPISGVKFEETQSNVEPLVASAETGRPGYFAISEDLGTVIGSDKYVRVTIQGITERVKYIKQIPLTKYLLVVFETLIYKIDIQETYQCGKLDISKKCIYEINNELPKLEIPSTDNNNLKYPLVLSRDNLAVIIIYDKKTSRNNKIKLFNHESMEWVENEFELNSNEIMDFTTFYRQAQYEQEVSQDILVIGAGNMIYAYNNVGEKVGQVQFTSGFAVNSLTYIDKLNCILVSDISGQIECFNAQRQDLQKMIQLDDFGLRIAKMESIPGTTLAVLAGTHLQKIAIMDIQQNSVIKTIQHHTSLNKLAAYIQGTGYVVYKENSHRNKYTLTAICDDNDAENKNLFFGFASGRCQECNTDNRFYRACTDCPPGEYFDFITCREENCLPNCPICKEQNCLPPKIFTPANGDKECTCLEPQPPTPTPKTPTPKPPTPTEPPEPVPTPEQPQQVICVEGQWLDKEQNSCNLCYSNCPMCEGPLKTDCLLPLLDIDTKQQNPIPYPLEMITGIIFIYLVCGIATIMIKKLNKKPISMETTYQNLEADSNSSTSEKEQNALKENELQKNKNPLNKIIPEGKFPVIQEQEQEYQSSKNDHTLNSLNSIKNNQFSPKSINSLEISENPSKKFDFKVFTPKSIDLNGGSNLSGQQFLETQTQDILQYGENGQAQFSQRYQVLGTVASQGDEQAPLSGRNMKKKGENIPLQIKSSKRSLKK